MKFLIVLALAVIGSQAAFTGCLVEQIQPMVEGLRVNHPARSSTEATFQTQLGEAISQTITNTVNQIQNAVEQVQNIAQILSNSVSTAVQQGAAIGQQAVQQAQTLLSSLLSNILGAFGKNKSDRELPAQLISIIQSLGHNPAVLNLIHSTQLYNCLIGKGVEIEYNHLADLYYANELAAAFQAARPQVRECVEEQGGLSVIHDIVRPYVQTIINLLNSLNIYDLVHDTLISILGQDLYDQYVAPVLNGKSLFSNAFGAVSQGVQQLGSYIASVAQSAIATLQEKVEAIKQAVAQFVQNGLQTAQQMTFQAAQDLVNFIQPFREDLGELYNQVVDQLSGIYSGLVLPF